MRVTSPPPHLPTSPTFQNSTVTHTSRAVHTSTLLRTPAATETPTMIYTTNSTDIYSVFDTSTLTHTSAGVPPSGSGCPTIITVSPECRGTDIPCHSGSAITPKVALHIFASWRGGATGGERILLSTIGEQVPLDAGVTHVFDGGRAQVRGQPVAHFVYAVGNNGEAFIQHWGHSLRTHGFQLLWLCGKPPSKQSSHRPLIMCFSSWSTSSADSICFLARSL